MKNLAVLFLLVFSFSSCGNPDKEKAVQLYNDATAKLKSPGLTKADILQSIADYSEAIKLDPEFWEAYRNRGNIYAQIGENDKAISDITIAIEHSAGDALSVLSRAKAYWLKGEKEKACIDYTNAIKQDPSLEKFKEFLECL